MKSADDRYNPKSCRFSKEWMFLQAFLTALALNTELGVANDEIDGISNVLLARLYALFAQIEFGIRSRGFFLTVLTAALFVGYMWISQKKRFFSTEKHAALAAFLSAMYTGGMAYWYGGSLSLLYSFHRQIQGLLVDGLLLILVVVDNGHVPQLPEQGDKQHNPTHHHQKNRAPENDALGAAAPGGGAV